MLLKLSHIFVFPSKPTSINSFLDADPLKDVYKNERASQKKLKPHNSRKLGNNDEGIFCINLKFKKWFTGGNF